MNQKLHILFLCGWYPSKAFPTNGDFIQRHAEAVSLQHQVSVLHIVTDKNASQNTVIDSQKINGVTAHIAYIKANAHPILKWIRFYKAYRQLLKKIDSVDHIHVNTLFPFGIFALHLKWFKKIPFIISEHWSGYYRPQSKNILFFERVISKIITKNAAFVCPVSNSLKNAMLHLGLKGNYIPVPNVVNTELFSPIDKKEKQFTIVHVSNMENACKNISGMLKIAKQLETEIGSFTWKFIGGTSDQFKPLIEQLSFKQDTIQFINHISQKELALHIQTAHLCVSFSNYETFGIAMTEAISCGIPVISTNTGILNELDSEPFFTIISVKNEHALFKELLAHHRQPYPENTTKMHGYIRKKFSDKVIAETFSKLYFTSIKLPS